MPDNNYSQELLLTKRRTGFLLDRDIERRLGRRRGRRLSVEVPYAENVYASMS